ncbi:hypothetical protein IWW39_006543, partial [Coemansia spiralis]
MEHILPCFIAYSCIALEYVISQLGVFNFLRLLVCIGACWWAAMKAQAVAQRHAASRFVTQISLNDSRSRVRRTASTTNLPAQDDLRSPVFRLTATQVTEEPLLQATRESEESQPPVSHHAKESLQAEESHQAEECQPPASLQGEELPQGEESQQPAPRQGEEPQLPISHQAEESHQTEESQQLAPRQGKEPHPPALW